MRDRREQRIFVASRSSPSPIPILISSPFSLPHSRLPPECAQRRGMCAGMLRGMHMTVGDA